MEEYKVAVIVGPTATGKSRLAFSMAKTFHGEIISADSMQIYKGMQIGTAQASLAEMEEIPHHLMNQFSLDKNFNVTEYVTLARKCIANITKKGKLPILVGGTGLYIRSLLHNTAFIKEPYNKEIRDNLLQRVNEVGGETLLEELRQFDPESAQKIHPNNHPRLVRAIEIYQTTGITMTEHNQNSHKNPSPYKSCIIGLNFSNRELLYEQINQRVDQMFAIGLLKEAKTILSSSNAKTALQAIGYKELKPYFEHVISIDEAKENIKRKTRRYAKRQLTWFRIDLDIHWIVVDDFYKAEKQVQELLAKNLQME